MSLPSEYIDSPGDMGMRLGRAIIEYNGDPVIHLPGMQRRTSGTVGFSRGDGHTMEVSLKDEGLSVYNLGAHCGLFTTEYGVGYFARIPTRQYCQGLNTNNTAAYMIVPKDTQLLYLYAGRGNKPKDIKYDGEFQYGEKVTGAPRNICQHYDISYWLMFCLQQQGFHDMWHNKYPKLETIKDKGLVALSRYFYTDMREGVLYAAGIMNPIGTIQNGRCRYEDRHSYLAQSVERQTGIMPI